jgi:hypothetical protein
MAKALKGSVAKQLTGSVNSGATKGASNKAAADMAAQVAGNSLAAQKRQAAAIAAGALPASGSSSGSGSSAPAQATTQKSTDPHDISNTVYGTGTGNTSTTSPHSIWNANDQQNLDNENAAWASRNQTLLGNIDADRTAAINQLQNNQPTMGSMMDWAQAMTQARQKEDPLYDQKVASDTNTIEQNAVKSGFYGQLPTEALKQQTAASDEAARNSDIFDLANDIMTNANNMTISEYTAKEQTFKDSLDGYFSLLSADSGEQNQEWQQNYDDNSLAFQKEQEAFQEAISIAGLTGNWNGQRTLQGQLDDATKAYNAAQTKLLQEQAQKQAIDNQTENAANKANIANTNADTAAKQASTAETKKQTSLLGQNTGSSSSSGSSGRSSGSSSSGSKSSSGSGSSSSGSSLSDLLGGSSSSSGSSSGSGSGSSSNSSSNSKSKNSGKNASSKVVSIPAYPSKPASSAGLAQIAKINKVISDNYGPNQTAASIKKITGWTTSQAQWLLTQGQQADVYNS